MSNKKSQGFTEDSMFTLGGKNYYLQRENTGEPFIIPEENEGTDLKYINRSRGDRILNYVRKRMGLKDSENPSLDTVRKVLGRSFRVRILTESEMRALHGAPNIEKKDDQDMKDILGEDLNERRKKTGN